MNESDKVKTGPKGITKQTMVLNYLTQEKSFSLHRWMFHLNYENISNGKQKIQDMLDQPTIDYEEQLHRQPNYGSSSEETYLVAGN